MARMFNGVTVGIVGCGDRARWAWALYLRTLGARLLCFDATPGLAAGLAADFGATAFGSLQQLLDQKPHGVVIATEPGDRFESAMRALAAGAHVVVDLPVADDPAAAAELATAARERERMLFHPFEQLILLEDVLELVGRRAIGEITEVNCTWRRRDRADRLLAEVGASAIAMVGELLPLVQIAEVRAMPSAHGALVQLRVPSTAVTLEIASGVQIGFEEEVHLGLVGTAGTIGVILPPTRTAPAQPGDRPRGVLWDSGAGALIAVGSIEDAYLEQTWRWLESLSGGPLRLPIDGPRGAPIASLLHAALLSRDAGGAPVTPERVW